MVPYIKNREKLEKNCTQLQPYTLKKEWAYLLAGMSEDLQRWNCFGYRKECFWQVQRNPALKLIFQQPHTNQKKKKKTHQFLHYF
jgi:hypothetical protein